MDENMNPRTLRVREALMQATLELVGDRPVSEISLTEIAEEAGVSRPTVYKQFTDTPTLVAATAEKHIENIFDEIDKDLSKDDGVQYIYDLMSRFMEAITPERGFSRHAMFGPSAATITTHVTMLLSDRMRRGVVGQRLAEAGDKSSEDCTLVISGGVIWMLAQWLDTDSLEGENAPEIVAERMADAILLLSDIEASKPR